MRSARMGGVFRVEMVMVSFWGGSHLVRWRTKDGFIGSLARTEELTSCH